MDFTGISAVLLAAGESRRMGQPKLLMPWRNTTILGQVIATFTLAGITDIIVVTGGWRERVEAHVDELAVDNPIRAVYNPDYSTGGMLSSIQAGITALNPGSQAVLIGLGDQPQVRTATIQQISAIFIQTNAALIVPSFQMRRGHPWLASRILWPDLLASPTTMTPRQFIDIHSKEIMYFLVEDDSILNDVDTPEDYLRQEP